MLKCLSKHSLHDIFSSVKYKTRCTEKLPQLFISFLIYCISFFVSLFVLFHAVLLLLCLVVLNFMLFCFLLALFLCILFVLFHVVLCLCPFFCPLKLIQNITFLCFVFMRFCFVLGFIYFLLFCILFLLILSNSAIKSIIFFVFHRRKKRVRDRQV